MNNRLVEIDEKIESLKVVIHGKNIDFDGIKDYMDKNGASIHSVDNIVARVYLDRKGRQGYELP